MEQRLLELSTGIRMNVALAGRADAPPVILLHGFPESHRTWRSLAPLLADDFRLAMPDQRGFGASDKPQDVADYESEILLADLFALADALEIERFALVGHDWGGAIAWMAALSGNPRVERLGIVNSPHPLIFQKSLIEDEEQRAASQYIRAFRKQGLERMVEGIGFEAFFDKSFAPHVDMTKVSAEERQRYIADWSQPGALTAMLNWYRASKLVVPPPGITVPVPDFALPKIDIPVCVIWGMDDRALRPVQLEGIEEVGRDVTVVPLPGVGHFAPWEAPEAVADGLRPFLAGR
ncbi:alpha/beta fold hydrolase [Sphingomonas mesophila]|uniref:alpha/beta fold hydrolase n=1 Tax=Sphingomonas mesophila TaxID=2303576 RepID=UPI000E571988|nr:alpha/beta hydrolase [Sphingomonas mesophila]